jgi:nitrite reductase (cytochrome c-552)
MLGMPGKLEMPGVFGVLETPGEPGNPRFKHSARLSALRHHYVLLLFALLLVAGIAGCASFTTGGKGVEGNSEESLGEAVYNSDFARIYPLEYASFLRGGLALEEDGLVHSHASLRYRVETDAKIEETGLACVSCKSADFNDIYARRGDEVFSRSYAGNQGEVIDFWSCRGCHPTGNPYDGAQAALVAFTTLGGSYAEGLNPKNAACGQCHNAICDYTRYIVGNSGKSLADFNPYRYGSDANSLRRAMLEDGMVSEYQPELDVSVAYIGHPDIELFNGSVHESRGLTCASCHMPVQQSPDGQTYHSHDSSDSPLNNEAAMQSCLPCHSEQGITDSLQMREFVRRAQDELAELEEQTQGEIDQLKQAIIAINARADAGQPDTAAALDFARQAYADASFYLSFQRASAELAGTKVAHNPQAMRDYLAQASQLCQQGLASLRESGL